VNAFCSNGTPACADTDEITNRYSNFAPRAGFNYEFIPSLALFGSYAESFADSKFGFRADGSVTEPETATQYEIGVKGRWLNGRLNATLDYFDLTKTNVTTPTVNPFIVEQTGEARSRGVEFDLSGELTEHLSIFASYAYLGSQITRDADETGGPRNTGNGLPNAPGHSGSLWTKYEFDNGFGVGAGLFGVSERDGDLANTFKIPAYVRVDASASYRVKIGKSQLTTQLNVNNLLDEEFIEYTGGRGRTFIHPGAPRSFIGSVRVDF
jgi:iron complex outermembrane receptor protein